MKVLFIILISALAVSCAKNEHSSKKQNVGVTPQGNMPTNGNYNTCDFEKVVFGSFYYSVYSLSLIHI